MYLHFNKHIYLAFFNEDLIILDLIRDKYIICSSEIKECINILINYPIYYKSSEYSVASNINIKQEVLNRVVSTLIKEKILSSHLYSIPFPYKIPHKLSSGVSCHKWKLEESKIEVKQSISSIFYCLWVLFKVRFLLRMFGINYIINKIRKIKPLFDNQFSYTKALILEQKLNQACFIYPTKTKCLEWAISYVLLAFKAKIPCNLVIGVQTIPFMAHAWVEVNGHILADSAEISSDVTIILCEPFNRMDDK